MFGDDVEVEVLVALPLLVVGELQEVEDVQLDVVEVDDVVVDVVLVFLVAVDVVLEE